MSQGRIVVITGSPGTGKSTTASLVAKESDMDKSVHMRTDDFYHYLSKGAIPPHLPAMRKNIQARRMKLRAVMSSLKLQITEAFRKSMMPSRIRGFSLC